MTPRTRLSERAWQDQVLELAAYYRWRVFHAHDSRREVVNRTTGEGRLVGDRQMAGFPDLLLVRDRVLYRELKTDTGPVTAEQQAWLDALLFAGADAAVWRPRDLELVRDELAARDPDDLRPTTTVPTGDRL